MPRCTLRKQFMDRIHVMVLIVMKQGVNYKLKLLGLPIDEMDELLFRCRQWKLQIERRWYLSRKHYKKRTNKFCHYFDTSSDECLSDKDFRFHFRITRVSFWELVDLLKDSPAFQRKNSDSRGPLPKPVSHQLLVFLKYYGCEGNQASSISLSNFFGVAAGVIDSCRYNALHALFFWKSPLTFGLMLMNAE